MDADLVTLLDERAGALGAAVETALLAQDVPHYRDAHPRVLRDRCDRLVAAFVAAARQGGPPSFERYVRSIVDERVAEGFALREVQHALSALESRLWPLVVDLGGDTATVVRRLAVVTGIVGRGKDELARAFLDRKEKAEAEVATLSQRLDRLFRGTEPPPEA
jgi:hypothetical protein